MGRAEWGGAWKELQTFSKLLPLYLCAGDPGILPHPRHYLRGNASFLTIMTDKIAIYSILIRRVSLGPKLMSFMLTECYRECYVHFTAEISEAQRVSHFLS